MAVKKNYAVELPDNDEVTPFIYRTEENQGMIWRDAKKIVRQWYLDQATKLRSFTEANFVANELAAQEQAQPKEADATVSDTSGQAS